MSNLAVYIPRLTRRQFLRIGTVAIAGYDLMPMIRPVNVVAKERVKPRGTADFCLFVFLQGGASHLDTFDVKEGRWTPPDAADALAGRGARPDRAHRVRLSAALAQGTVRAGGMNTTDGLRCLWAGRWGK